MAIEDDDKPRKKVSHEIGQDLSLLSVEELTERIALMTSEIARLQAAMAKKRASRDAASSFLRSEDALCQWPSWQIKHEKNRSFTIG